MKSFNKNSLATKKYVDVVATGLEWIEASKTRHPDSFGKEGQAYFCTTDQCTYVKSHGSWSLLSTSNPCTYWWCPICNKKHMFVEAEKKNLCSGCKNNLIQLDITFEIYKNLPEYCSKGDIVEAAIGEQGGL